MSAGLLIALSSCGPRIEKVANDPQETQIYTLKNGMKVFMSVNKERPRIQTYMAVKVGSKNDPSETTGLAHYFEHLMFKGTEHFGTCNYEAEKPLLDSIEALFEVYRTKTDPAERAAIYHQIDSVSYEASKYAIPNEYDKLMALIGASGTNAWTSDDETVYTEDIPSNQIDNWAKIQADRFRYGVIRGFHTELETIYEEKNMSLTSDSRKVWESIAAALYPHHPYGQQTTLGTQEHLKNPSITNVKKYHDNYYVPNNIAVCVAGDFDPKEMVAAIEKYFGDWEPNPNVPVLKYEKEAPITSPIVKEVYGLESENMAMAWPIPGESDLQTSAVAEIAGSILQNGKAGLVDLDIIQQQKALSFSAGYSSQPDYSQFIVMASPKEGQSLEELRDLGLEEIAKLRAGDFDESLIEATINNAKLSKMRSLENNSARARAYVNAFIAGIDWKDAATELQRLESVTKEDVVAFANKYLSDNGYAIVYKRQGEDNSVQRISAPKITPIVTNRDLQSDFLLGIQNSEVAPIEPVYVDFEKDMSQFDLADGVNVLYKHNDINDIFNLSFKYNYGTASNQALALAFDYISYLGTPTKSAEEIAASMYKLACNYGAGAGINSSSFSVSGLSENMSQALKIVEDLIVNAVPDEEVLSRLKADMIKSRINSKKNQSANFSALQRYMVYGADYIKNNSISNEQLLALTSDELLKAARDVFDLGHEVSYYGPLSEQELKDSLLANHHIAPDAKALPEVENLPVTNKDPQLYLVQYNAAQIYYYQYSNRGESYSPEATAQLSLYNNYFGGGMNSIVFQEMREARGLAYSANARLYSPSAKEGSYYFTSYIATQNDKMRQAIEAFDDIINNMPISEAAFKVAKESLITSLRTQRYQGSRVLDYYRSLRRLGLCEPIDKQVFEEIQGLTLEDVQATQQKWVKGRNYVYGILGDIKDLDTKYLSTLGPVKVLSQEEIFGY